jgi:hypothetical protein
MSFHASVEMNQDYVTLRFHRRDDAESHESVAAVEWGADLTGWTAVPIGIASVGADASDVIVQVTENGEAPDVITVAIPRSLATEGTLFTCLKVSE